MRKIKETLRLHFDAGISNQAIAVSLQISKGSVFNTLERFKEAKLSWPLPADITEVQLEEALYQAKTKTEERNKAKAKPDYAHIARQLSNKHVTRQLLYEEFREECPDGIGRSVFYSGFKAYLGKHDMGGQQLLLRRVHSYSKGRRMGKLSCKDA